MHEDERNIQITSSALVVGCRYRKVQKCDSNIRLPAESYKMPISFEKNRKGFEFFVSWSRKIMKEQEYPGHYRRNGTNRSLQAEP
ncbi:hypothetical protein VK70_24435 [Paenibacillus durus ATCC 35681]|uniref:Uncharacterized protein n=1 Tax=Paenibacillus durus ATCC 35681 TaxID=1333534 RepID=A0A0F7FEE4_PAEDU|nr:hypothetical protein VK70_24435 [Paenibacillus durus ATCC 35681]